MRNELRIIAAMRGDVKGILCGESDFEEMSERVGLGALLDADFMRAVGVSRAPVSQALFNLTWCSKVPE